MSEKVQVGLNMNLVHSTARRGVTNNDNTGTSYWYVLPFTPNFVDLEQRADGTWPINPFIQSNPLQTATMLDNPEKVWRMITSAKADIQLQNSESSNLKLVGNAGVDFFNQLNSWYSPPDLQFEDDDGLLGTAIRINTNNIQINGTSTLVHTWKPASEFLQATTSAGMQYEVRDRLTSGAIAKDLIGAQTGVDQGTPEVREKRERQIDMGVYAQEEVMLLDEKLLLTAGIRADRSSNAGDPEKFFFYPKVSASYRFANLIPRVDELKFRLAYGESGNQPLFSQKYTKLVANRRAGGVAGLQLDLNAGDPDIKPERAQELEGGVDLNVFGGRATIEASAYRTVITDLLLQRGLAPSSGFTTLFFNAGELLSWGYEGAIAGTPIQSEQLTWLLRTTYTMSRNKVQNLPIPSFLVGGFGVGYGTFRIKEGEAITNMVGTRDTEVAILGSSNPDFRISLTNDITVAKRLTLYALLDWQKGATIANVTKANYDLAKNGRDYEELGAERWTKFGRFTENWIDDASFVKLREVSLAYDVPPAAIEKLWGNLQSVRLSLVGRDLKTWTDYWGMDPEVSNFGAQQFARNIDHSPFPPSRSFWFGIDLSF
jgi:outer membrane receptor protein involved in Fe transport